VVAVVLAVLVQMVQLIPNALLTEALKVVRLLDFTLVEVTMPM
jgi:hypothetical protein